MQVFNTVYSWITHVWKRLDAVADPDDSIGNYLNSYSPEVKFGPIGKLRYIIHTRLLMGLLSKQQNHVCYASCISSRTSNSLMSHMSTIPSTALTTEHTVTQSMIAEFGTCIRNAVTCFCVDS